MLAEVFGNVGDELKSSNRAPEKLSDGRIRLPGSLKLDEAEPWLGVNLAGEASTLGGQVFHELGHLPSPGDIVTLSGVELEVESVRDRTVTSLLAQPIARPEESP